jgi:hypothetical protein
MTRGQAECLDRVGCWEVGAAKAQENHGLRMPVDSNASRMPDFWLSRLFIRKMPAQGRLKCLSKLLNCRKRAS